MSSIAIRSGQVWRHRRDNRTVEVMYGHQVAPYSNDFVGTRNTVTGRHSSLRADVLRSRYRLVQECTPNLAAR